MDPAFDPPVVASASDTGVVLDVAGIGIHDPIGVADLYLELADGTRRQLPAPLRDWAITMLATHGRHTAIDELPVFPCRVEFGVLHGRMYAIPQPSS
ncbi:hypothetical protein [Nocardia spumae]|uniref:hypothetical protein n=1 Tax=Nocardia spumae TaxID=2887190 RepID=UPI001D15CA94|nr:hypothetical protein [Nocardia spumae]